MELYFLSVGYGEAIVVLDDVHCMVIDGGADASDAAYQQPGTISLYQFLVEKQVSQIDLMIATHLHNDHISGLAQVAERFPVKEFRCNCYPTAEVSAAIAAARPECANDLSLRLFTAGITQFARLRKALERQNTTIIQQPQTNGYETIWDGCELRFYGMNLQEIEQRNAQFNAFCQMQDAEEQRDAMRRFDKMENTCSLACSLQIGSVRAMLTGDLCSGWDARCAEKDFDNAQILKVTHHGQQDGMPDSMLAGCDPQVVVMCADADCTFSSACPSVRNRAKAYLESKHRPVQIYHTGRLVDAFGEQASKQPCALCCVMQETVTCIPYYQKEGKA